MICRQPPHVPGRFIRLLSALIPVAFLTGCRVFTPHEDPTRFYVLTAPHAASEPVSDGSWRPWRIGLKRVELPVYLRTPSMVVRTGENEIHFSDYDRWAEPLDQGIGRVMNENLIQARHVSSVALNAYDGGTFDCVVSLRILACEGVRREPGPSAIRFSVTWDLTSYGTNVTGTQHGGFNAGPEGWNGRDYGQLAARLSEALALASTALAADLQGANRPAPKVAQESRP